MSLSMGTSTNTYHLSLLEVVPVLLGSFCAFPDTAELKCGTVELDDIGHHCIGRLFSKSAFGANKKEPRQPTHIQKKEKIKDTITKKKISRLPPPLLMTVPALPSVGCRPLFGIIVIRIEYLKNCVDNAGIFLKSGMGWGVHNNSI